MNILFNGCSFTWGDELNNQSKRFSDLIGGINISQCGRSNDGIARTTVDWLKTNSCDLTVIQWTVPQRTETYIDQKYENISTFKEYAGWQDWYKYCYNNQIGIDNLFKNAFLLRHHLESKGIKYFFMYHDCWFDNIFKPSPWKDSDPLHIIRGHREHKDSILPHKSICPECYMPKEHPSEKGHQLIADYIKHHAHIL